MTIARLSEVSLEYFEQGEGPNVVVFVHGYQASARVWHGVQQALPAQQYRSIAINNRGAGATEAPPNESDFTIQKFAADAFELVSQLGLARFTLVGHSMGGATVAQFAVDHPELVSGLVLLDPASPNGAAMEPAQLEAFLDQRMVLRREQQARGAGNDGIDARGSTDFDPEQLRLLMQDTAAAPERRLRGSMRSMMQLRLADRVKALPMPVLLAAGDRDAIIPLENMLASWAMYPRGTGLHVWHGEGHSPNVDCPRQVAALLQRFIESPRKPAGAR
ncbi:MAG: alpha/beta hydrolase [Burkholderiaceae bacterium]|jgi:pimeloyl-ACP methyl ester carboxylesterase|nr:alpha/beta hydrolase [Burkholderiaceae bacterium]MBP7660476.1 alpha/beta hydrolase [Burkholderiaceae bacterium]